MATQDNKTGTQQLTNAAATAKKVMETAKAVAELAAVNWPPLIKSFKY